MKHLVITQPSFGETSGAAVIWRFLHENFVGRQLVTKGVIHLAGLKRGWVRVYRPMPKKN